MERSRLGDRIPALLAVAVCAVCCNGDRVSALPAPFQTVSASVQKQLNSSRESGGIKVERVTHAVGGMKLDLRYRVTDIIKARQVLTDKTALALIDQATGTVLGVPNMPKVGKMRQIPSQDETWRVYWMMFDNPGALVKRGGRVTVVIGDIRIKDIIVE